MQMYVITIQESNAALEFNAEFYVKLVIFQELGGFFSDLLKTDFSESPNRNNSCDVYQKLHNPLTM